MGLNPLVEVTVNSKEENSEDFLYIFWRARCVGHSFAYVAHFVFLRDVWIRTQRAAIACRHVTNLATHPPNSEEFLSQLRPRLRPLVK